MLTQENRTIVQAMIDAINNGDVEKAISYTHPECTLDGKPFGRDGDRMRSGTFMSAFPGQVWTIDRMIAEGEWVSMAYTFQGDFTGQFGEVPPTGKPVIFTGVTQYRLRDGQFIEIWEYLDRLTLYQQLGLIPAAA